MADDDDSVAQARAALEHASTLIHEAQAGIEAALNALSSPVETPRSHPVSNTHRQAHRPGRAAKLDTDAELRAFVMARIDTMTFEALADQIAAHFPAHRRVRKSAIYDWWAKNVRANGLV